ncbi:flagellar basal body rod C-terminal domain-containing protein [Undibacterium sp. MH2W]|uniref:flagellar basal body rod C-terminal domain-containing protein n=1 Tax=Undibacterium sp. MH2W TaxID=3413044 RepID=UPI003BF50944
MMSISSLSSGLSGMIANAKALDSSANNIANSSTNGYRPEVANFEERSPNGVTVNISQAGAAAASGATASSSSSSEAPSGTDLTSDTVNSIQYANAFKLNAQVVKTADQVLGTLVDLKA